MHVAPVSAMLTGHGLFARPMAVAAAKTMPAHRWWTAFGSGTPELQAVATRVLSQCVSASACERSWSTFDFVHTKKRNRLSSKKVSQCKSQLCNMLSSFLFLVACGFVLTLCVWLT